jgi:hypothetical protein
MAIRFRRFAEGQFESRPNLDCDLLRFQFFQLAAAFVDVRRCWLPARVRGCALAAAASLKTWSVVGV